MSETETKTPKLTKTDIAEALAADGSITKTAAKKLVGAVFECMSNALATGNDVAISDFGSFETRNRAGRTGRNPQTGEPIEIAPSVVVSFSPSSVLKAMVNG